jgi:alkaline phosphatase D
VKIITLFVALLPALTLATPLVPEVIETIVAGSCLRQSQPQPVWRAILAAQPDLFIAMGDNVYADTVDPEAMRSAYGRLGENPDYRTLRERVPVLATWDDHDYGANDAGADYPMRQESQRIFADFFELPGDSPVRTRQGVYDAHAFGPPGRRVQVILLDTRYFRGTLRRGPPSIDCPRGRYVPNEDPGTTILGEAQWTWLADQLREPADLRLLVSSIQVLPEEHCFEKWANLPHERERLFHLVREAGARGVVILSGDRHYAEISQLPANVVGYPLYELTASSLNAPGGPAGEPNRHRVTREGIPEANFGVVRIDWSQQDPVISLEVRGVDGQVVLSRDVMIGGLDFDAPTGRDGVGQLAPSVPKRGQAARRSAP